MFMLVSTQTMIERSTIVCVELEYDEYFYEYFYEYFMHCVLWNKRVPAACATEKSCDFWSVLTCTIF